MMTNSCVPMIYNSTITKMNIRKSILLLALPFALSSCVSVKAYQKMYLNDTEMELAAKKVEVFETNYEAYREGAAGANGGKVGGGCGCN
jgi:hypothetical protein